jgi:hypothetical protein
MFKSAAQASKEVSEAKNDRADLERILVAEAIETMIREEKKTFHIYSSISPAVVKELKKSGYVVDESNHRNEYLMTVSIEK